MQVSLRPYATAGVVLVAASAIAITPAVPPPTDVPVASTAVALTAAIDPITPWAETLQQAQANFTDLADAWLQVPFPVVQQVVANQIGYLSELPDFEAIIGQVQANLRAAITAPFAADPDTMDLGHQLVFAFLPLAAPELADLQPLPDFSTTYLSGVLLGLVGPVIGPVLALATSAQAIVNNLTGPAPDPVAALNDLINIPAVMTDAFLNGGQTLDVTPLVSALGLESDLLTSVGITFGGVLSPGGSIFNALDITALGGLLQIPGTGPGAIGSLIGLSHVIAKAIGWDGEGNPLEPAVTSETVREANDPAKIPASVTTSAPEDLQSRSSALNQTGQLTTALITEPDSLETTPTVVDDEAGEQSDVDDEQGSAATKQEEANAGSQPSTKGNTPASSVKDAVGSASDRVDAAGSDVKEDAKGSDSDTKPSDTKPSDTKPSDTKPSDTKPSDTKRPNTKSSASTGSDNRGSDSPD